ncbi:unnamed protein product [Cladocopium goreaui]|nr:unnamed protein product [Cladocopium goreaui]
MSKLSPVTPPHLIRRNNTPTILHGSVGDQAILQPATGNSTGSKSKASRPRHLKRNQRAKKNRLSAAKSKAARPDTTDAATAPVPVSHAVPEVPDASGSDAANEIQPPPETTAAPQQSGPRDGSPASVRTHAYTATADGMPVPASVGQNKASLPPMLLVKKEPKEPVTLPGLKTTTPTSQRRATHVAHAKNENMQRANTQDLAQPAGTPSATPANANAPPPKCSAPPPRPTTWQPHHKIVYTDDAENNINHPSEYPQDFLDTLADAEDQSQNNTNGTVSTGGGPPDEPGDRRKKVKTAHQKAMHARYMRFSRSLKSAKTPVEIRRAGKSAAYCHEKLQILLEAWEASKGEWSSSQLYKTITQRKTTTCHGARVWLTRTQIASKYQDQSIADCICDAKLADKELAASQTKWHPDGVGIEALRLFLVWDSEGISEKEDSIIEDLFSAADKDESDSECSRTKRKKSSKSKKSKKSKKPSSESSPSSDEGSDDESNDSGASGEDKKKKKKKGGKAKKSKGKGKKEKKETDEQKQKRLRKEKEKADKEEKTRKDKAENELIAKAKKAGHFLCCRPAPQDGLCTCVRMCVLCCFIVATWVTILTSCYRVGSICLQDLVKSCPEPGCHRHTMGGDRVLFGTPWDLARSQKTFNNTHLLWYSTDLQKDDCESMFFNSIIS